MPKPKFIAGILAFCFGFTLVAGCDSTPTSPDKPKSQTDSLTAEEIFGEVIRQYQAADSYTDQARLYLNYRIDGRPIQEPQPWSTRWVRGEGLSSRLFNSQIDFDHQLLSCYIFDIDSGNLDDQQWVIPADQATKIDELFSDPIARHFLCGFSELPLDESRDTPQDCLTPPILNLICGLQTSDWFDSKSPPRRLPDQQIDETDCYVLEFSPPRGAYQVFIDQQTGLVVQVAFPLVTLDQRVLQAGEIEDVTLYARFHDAKLNTEIDLAEFKVKRRAAAQPVRQFVAIPEPFPCDNIGQPLVVDAFLQPDGTPFPSATLAGKTTVFQWFGSDLDSLRQLTELAGTTPQERFQFIGVYSDPDLAQPGSDSSRPSDAVQSVVANGAPSPSVSIVYDPELKTSQRAQLKVIPAVLVIGPDLTIQFVQGTQEEGWQKRLMAAMQRVSNGDNLADEMKREYQEYLKTYAQQITQNDQSAVFDPVSHAQQEDSARPPARMERLWSLRSAAGNQLIASGNLISAGGTLYVLDGFQTIHKISANGVHDAPALRLELPPGEGVTRLRKLKGPRGDWTFACFSKLGPAPYLFDGQWQLLKQQIDLKQAGARFDTPPLTVQGLSDCQLDDAENTGLQLSLAFADGRGFVQKIIQTNLPKKDPLPNSVSPPSSAETSVNPTIQQPVYALNGPQANLLLSDAPNARKTVVNRMAKDPKIPNLSYQTLTGTPEISVACGYDEGRQWRAVGMAPTGELLWNRPTKSQDFNSDFENVALNDESKWIAIADHLNQIEILDYAGNLVARQRFEKPIVGICWLPCELMSQETYNQLQLEKKNLEQVELPRRENGGNETQLEGLEPLEKRLALLASQLRLATVVEPNKIKQRGDGDQRTVCLAVSLGDAVELWQIRTP